MKIQFTFTEAPYVAGMVYDLPEKQAQKFIEQEKAIPFVDPAPENKPKKAVKHDNDQDA